MSRIASTGNATSYIDRMSTPTLGRYPEHAPVTIQSQEQIERANSIAQDRPRSVATPYNPEHHACDARQRGSPFAAQHDGVACREP